MEHKLMKFFNTAGPVNRPNHYKIDPMKRWDFEDILSLIQQEKYFLLHAPRQTGKTSCLLSLRDLLNKSGEFNAVYCNVEAGQAGRNNVSRVIPAIVSALGLACGVREIPADENFWFTALRNVPAEEQLHKFLVEYCSRSEKPVVLLLDEVDALVGDSLISVLRQIRSGYDKRPDAFPQSLMLCGVRDIKDYRIQTSGKEIITGGSCFNIKSKSLTLGNFSEEEVRELFQKHTEETGQVFEEEIYPQIMRYTAGQPWLVNALAYEVTFEVKKNRDPSVVITFSMIEQAKERLILSRATHLDQLADKLEEERVRNVVLPIILGEEVRSNKDDIEYCIDLGLIRKTSEGLIVSNEIYREIIPRELSSARQTGFLTTFRPDWILEDGRIDSNRLCVLFQQFWRENSEIWASHIVGYQEAAPQLVFQAFLQRVANGSGIINREYALGRRRTDLMLKWRYPEGEQRIVIELKTLNKKQSLETVRQLAIEQTYDYAETCGATESHLLIFDRDNTTNWSEQLYQESVTHKNRQIHIWGM